MHLHGHTRAAHPSHSFHGSFTVSTTESVELTAAICLKSYHVLNSYVIPGSGWRGRWHGDVLDDASSSESEGEGEDGAHAGGLSRRMFQRAASVARAAGMGIDLTEKNEGHKAPDKG